MAPTKQAHLDFPARRSSRRNKENSLKEKRTASLPPPAAATSTASEPRHLGKVTKTPTKNIGSPLKALGVSPLRSASPRKALSPLKALGNSPLRSCSPRKVLTEIATPDQVSPSKRKPLLSVNSAPVTPASSAKKRLFKRDTSRYMEAKKALSTAVPEVLVGRREQMDAMRGFLQDALVKKKGKVSAAKTKRSLYISGAPGTGKTASLKHLLNAMSPAEKKGFREVFINCMGLKASRDVFVKIAGEIGSGHEGGANLAEKYIEGEICKSGQKILLVLDEIDQLDSKDQEILYTIFEWPYLPGSRLVLVGIANALDLTDRILPRLKLSAAVSPTQLSFPPYTREEINKIITSRLKEAQGDGQDPIIKPMAVKFLAGKISSLSGDIRKALDVCRRAIELAEIEYRKQTILSPFVPSSPATSSSSAEVHSRSTEGSASPGGKAVGVKQIDLPQILRIFNEVYSSRVSAALKSGSGSDLPLQQKILLATLLLMTNYAPRKCKEVSLAKLHETYSRICKKRALGGLDLAEAASMSSLLEARGIFSVRKAKNVRDCKICLRIDESEVEAALQDKTLLSNIVSDASCIAK